MIIISCIRVAYQRDIHLALVSSDEHAVHYESSTGAQFLNLLVSGVNTKPFHIRSVGGLF